MIKVWFHCLIHFHRFASDCAPLSKVPYFCWTCGYPKKSSQKGVS